MLLSIAMWLLKLIKLTKELLEGHALSTLRVLGRAIGVKSPTSKNKDQLIDEILTMQETGVSFAKSKKGAPVKSKVDLSEFYLKDIPSFDFFNGDNGYGDNLQFAENTKVLTFYDNEPSFEVEGRLELFPAGYAFVRVKDSECTEKDSYLSPELVAKYNLRAGDKVLCKAKKAKEQKAPSVIEVISANNQPLGFLNDRPDFDSLTSCYPEERFNLNYNGDTTLKIIDLFSPIGKGQRGVIVAPPKTGKTTIIKKLCRALEENHNGIKIFVLLIDERP